MTEPEPAYALQPARTGALQPAHLMPEHTLLSLTRAMRKVILKLTWQQFGSLAMITSLYPNRCPQPGSVEELAVLHMAYKLSERLRQRMMRGPVPIVKISLSMPEAAALNGLLSGTDFADYAVYEANLALRIIAEIDKQTV